MASASLPTMRVFYVETSPLRIPWKCKTGPMDQPVHIVPADTQFADKKSRFLLIVRIDFRS